MAFDSVLEESKGREDGLLSSPPKLFNHLYIRTGLSASPVLPADSHEPVIGTSSWRLPSSIWCAARAAWTPQSESMATDLPLSDSSFPTLDRHSSLGVFGPDFGPRLGHGRGGSILEFSGCWLLVYVGGEVVCGAACRTHDVVFCRRLCCIPSAPMLCHACRTRFVFLRSSMCQNHNKRD